MLLFTTIVAGTVISLGCVVNPPPVGDLIAGLQHLNSVLKLFQALLIVYFSLNQVSEYLTTHCAVLYGYARFILVAKLAMISAVCVRLLCAPGYTLLVLPRWRHAFAHIDHEHICPLRLVRVVIVLLP